jgi:hypothetical protein
VNLSYPAACSPESELKQVGRRDHADQRVATHHGGERAPRPCHRLGDLDQRAAPVHHGPIGRCRRGSPCRTVLSRPGRLLPRSTPRPASDRSAHSSARGTGPPLMPAGCTAGDRNRRSPPTPAGATAQHGAPLPRHRNPDQRSENPRPEPQRAHPENTAADTLVGFFWRAIYVRENNLDAGNRR